jgi:hypothetical protein
LVAEIAPAETQIEIAAYTTRCRRGHEWWCHLQQPPLPASSRGSSAVTTSASPWLIELPTSDVVFMFLRLNNL